MAQAVAFAFVSLDGFIRDKTGDIEWHTPDESIHQFANDLQEPFSDHVYDEPMHEIMKFWEAPPGLASLPPVYQRYTQLWQKTHKTIISKRLTGLDPGQYTVLPEFTARSLAALKERAKGDVMVGGSQLVAAALSFGLLDRIVLFTVPVLLGGGEPCFPSVTRTTLKLLESRVMSMGWLYSSYTCRP